MKTIDGLSWDTDDLELKNGLPDEPKPVKCQWKTFILFQFNDVIIAFKTDIG